MVYISMPCGGSELHSYTVVETPWTPGAFAWGHADKQQAHTRHCRPTAERRADQIPLGEALHAVLSAFNRYSRSTRSWVQKPRRGLQDKLPSSGRGEFHGAISSDQQIQS